jgi:hypothetical protein
MMKYLFFFLAFFICAYVQAQKIVSHAMVTSEVSQYSRADFEIVIDGNFKNPYESREVMLDMDIISPSGKRLSLPCFFLEKNVWRARFTPQESGQYNYSFRLITNFKKVATVSDSRSFEVEASDKDGFLHTNGYWTLRFDSGKPFRGIGENVCWENRSFENQKWTYDYLLPTLSNNGANFFRVWMHAWNLPVAWKNVSSTSRYKNSNSYFNESGIQRMDEFIALSDSLGLHLMLALDAHGSLLPNGEWKNNAHNKLNGGPANTPTEFFTLEESKAMYKNRLRFLIARWGYSPSIAAWEFFNEIDNAVFTPTPHDSVLIDHKIITSWHDEMSTYLKKNDPYHHIITTSISHRDIKGMNDLPNIDLNQKHIYNRTHLIPSVILEYALAHKKPYVIGEFGYDWNWDNVKHEYGTNFDFDYKRGLWYGLFSPTPILPMTWWWEYFDERNMTPYFKNVKTMSDMMMNSGNGSFETIQTVAAGIESLAVRCGADIYVYVLNPGNASGGFNVLLKDVGSKNYTIKAYNTAEGIFSDLPLIKSKDNNLSLDPGGFNVIEDRIFILTPVTESARKEGSE